MRNAPENKDDDRLDREDGLEQDVQIASSKTKLAVITEASYRRKIDNLIRSVSDRLARLEMAAPPSSRDLLDQLLVRAIYLARRSFYVERMILIRHLRANERDADVLATCDRIARMKMEAIQNDGLTIALRWIDRLKSISVQPVSEMRATAKLVDDLEKRKAKEIASLLRVTTAAGPSDLALDVASIKKVAAVAARELVSNVLPADSAIVAELAGLRRGVAPDARQNTTHRKAQNRSQSLSEWRAVADLLAPRQPVDPETLWNEPRDFALIARTVWIAGLATGLRPIEWVNAGVFYPGSDGSDVNVLDDPIGAAGRRDQWVMIALNAKRKSDMAVPAQSRRTLRLGFLDAETQDAIVAAAMATDSIAAEDEKLWRTWMTNVAKRIASVATKAGFSAGLSLYDARHYFAWRAKQKLDDFEVAALMGHANIRSAGAYGARVKRPDRSEREIPVAELAALGIAAPTKENVDFVYKRAAKMQGWDIDPSTKPDVATSDRPTSDPGDEDGAEKGSAKTQD